MAASPSPGQLEYVYENTSMRTVNRSLVFGPPGEFYLSDWMNILSLVMVLVGLVGNSMVLWLLNFRTQKNPFSTYILNLTWADLLFLCCYLLIFIEELVTAWYSFMGLVLIHLAKAICTVSLSLLAAISTERCLAMLFPSWYLHDRPKNTSVAVCTVLWALSGLFWGADVVLCMSLRSPVFCGTWSRIPVVWLVHFTPVMCGSSLTLLLRVQCSSQRRQPPKLYLLVLLLVLVFLLCGLPMAIQEAITMFPLSPLHSPTISYMRYCLFRLLACLKCNAYPFIYFLLGSRRHRRGRDPLGVVLQRALEEDQELEGERRDSDFTNTRETSF